MNIKTIAPDQIEPESFRIIDREVENMRSRSSRRVPELTDAEYQIVRRIIHATGDFDFLDLVKFGNGAVQAGIDAIRSGRNILVDVNMAAMGISRNLLKRFGGEVICRISDEETDRMAKEKCLTRSEAAIERAAKDNIGIVAIGNAPTALLKTIKLIDQGLFKPDIVIGVPVGFVNAAESKELLMLRKDTPFISVRGNKGGTPVAVAAVNALLRLC